MTKAKATLLVGRLSAGNAWCAAAERDGTDPLILFGFAPDEIHRHLHGRHPEDVEIILVKGWGRPGPDWNGARATIQRYRTMGTEVRIWHGGRA